MPTINLTNNSDLNITASSADNNATLNRYLTSGLSFKTPPSFDALANLLVKDQHQLDFPITLSATGEGKFALKKTTLDIQLGASVSIGLLQDSDESDFLSVLNVAGDASSSGLVSLAVQAKLTAEDDATVSDFTFGIANSATVTLTGYHVAAANEKLADAVKKAAVALTIPHDLDDLRSLPPGGICRLDGASSLKFAASATYSFLNDPLAAVAISNLPSLGISATASATLEASVTHTSGHTLTIARLPNGLLHLAVSLKKTDDFETSLTVSSGVAAKIGDTDVLAFLLDKINPNSAAEADAIAAQMKEAAKFKSDIKSAIDTALKASLSASLQAALGISKVRNRAFLYEIDLNGLDNDSRSALLAALTGDFTAMTKTGPPLKGIQQLDSALTVTKDDKHTFVVHFLGIFNAASINDFVKKSKVDITSDTHELILSDETLQVVNNNLAAEKLRQLLLKDITLTLPASANTKDVDTPITLAYLDREGSTDPSTMRQFVNVLEFVTAPKATAAAALLSQKLKHYGACSLFCGLSLSSQKCRQLFIDGNNQPYDWMHYVNAMCNVMKAIYSGLDEDPENSYHLRLFRAGQVTWKALQDAGAASNMIPILKSLGMSETEALLAITDVITAIWWSQAMADYAAALAKGESLGEVGKEVVKDANLGYNEPWMILTTWDLAGRPTITSDFSSSLQAVGAAGK